MPTDMSETVLSVEVRPDDGGVTLILEGELDLASAPSLIHCLTELDPSWRDVVVDMAGVSFVDSSGLAALVRAATHGDGRTIRVCSPRPAVRRVLEITALEELLHVT